MPLGAALFMPLLRFDAAKIDIISEPCKHFVRKIFKVPIWYLEPLPLFHRFADASALELRRPAPYLAGMTLKEKIQKYFRRKAATQTPQQKGHGVEPVPLRIEGVKPAPLTPEPDDAELAAQALLESMCDVRSKMEDVRDVAADAHQPSVRDAQYYHALADRIRLARDQATLRTMRFVTWCEHELEKRDLPIEGKGSLAQMEAELYKRIDTIERVGGELKRRWQHCLANVIVRRMEEERKATEDGRRKMEDGEGGNPSDPNE